jgi:hypothetical protein
MIPDEAVEAALESVFSTSDLSRHVWGQTVRAILEAAAPHMLAEAFEQGQKSGMRHASRVAAAADIGRPDLPGPLSPNPYRSQA